MITVAPPKVETVETERPVTYAASQVDTGRRGYDRYCVMCHGDNLDNGEFGGPPLVGNRFAETFGQQPVSVLYSFIEAAMPPTAPAGSARRSGRTSSPTFCRETATPTARSCRRTSTPWTT